MSIVHRNHYVPEWYQKRFISPEQDKLNYLDLHPATKTLPNGNIVVMNELFFWSPKQCFCKQDLYTTSFLGITNDEIEKYLFGAIDDRGSLAVSAVVNNDFAKIHKLFHSFFEYLDAQKLRTPKGLAWINKKYTNLTQLQLMLEMQQIRQMHSTMWAESVREIVSAEDADIKFIITDHPVTIYNPKCPPDSEYCKYPLDPPISFKGSQTIFPLDINHCLILTNLEYAQNQASEDLLTNRTNARNFGQTISRIDNWIRDRKLNSSEVRKINYILKARACRYIAASKKEWLYPEADVHEAWSELGKVLLPSDDELYHFGGEMYVGYKDGSVHYQDAFGRTAGDTSYLIKEKIKGKVGLNDPCVCGSGKKYKKCCEGKSLEEMPVTNEYSIRERNIIFSRILEDILGLNKEGRTWEDVRREFSDEQVKEIHKAFQGLWPKDTNIINLLPRPDKRVSRAIYSGLIDPRTAARDIISFTSYFDEIIVINPFMNPVNVKPEYNPINSPGQFKQETIKNILFFMQLMPFVKLGVINIIPDPCSTNYHLQQQIWDMAEKRYKAYTLLGYESDLEMDEAMNKILEDDFQRGMTSFADEQLKKSIQSGLPNLTDKELEELLSYIKQKRVEDPLALLQPLEAKDGEGQFLMTHVTPNLELGMFLAQLTGSFIYTNNKVRWQEISRLMDAFNNKTQWDNLSNQINALDINLEIDPLFNLHLRNTGGLGSMRKAFREIYQAVQKEYEPDSISRINKNLVNELNLAYQKSLKEWESNQEWKARQPENQSSLSYSYKGKVTCLIPVGGFSLNQAQRLVVSYGNNYHLQSMPMAMFVEYIE